MGGALHRATRIFRMYNIENRVEKVLSKEKPTIAPRLVPKAAAGESNESMNVAPEEIHQRNDQLLNYLHDVKVYSKGDNPVIRRVQDTKEKSGKLPALDRLAEPLDESSVDGAFGYVEPQRIPPGRVSLRQFFAYLQQYRDKPDEYSVNRFAEMYTIKPEIAERLFKYHSLLALQEVKRIESRTPETTPHLLSIDARTVEDKSSRKSVGQTGITSKY